MGLFSGGLTFFLSVWWGARGLLSEFWNEDVIIAVVSQFKQLRNEDLRHKILPIISPPEYRPKLLLFRGVLGCFYCQAQLILKHKIPSNNSLRK